MSFWSKRWTQRQLKIEDLNRELRMTKRALDEESQRRRIAEVQASEWRAQLETAKFTADYWQKQAVN